MSKKAESDSGSSSHGKLSGMTANKKTIVLISALAVLLFAAVCSSGCTYLMADTSITTLTPGNAPVHLDPSDPLDALYAEHVISFDGVRNARDMGGYPAADGKTVKKGLLIRSGNLAKLSEKDADVLENTYHLRHIFDFRTENEHLDDVDKEVRGAAYHWIKVNEDYDLNIDVLSKITIIDVISPGGFQKTEFSAEKLEERGFSDLLKKLLLFDEYYQIRLGGIKGETKSFITSEESQAGYREFFRILVENAGEPVLWHCVWGKDRTGIAAALLLSALGVDKETILNDYELTNVTFRDFLNIIESELRFYEANDDTVARILSIQGGVDRRNLEEALALIDSEYGGMEAYLHNQMGLTDADLEKLRAAYLE